jgi:hypothetical protein
MYAGQWRVYQDAKGVWHWRRETVNDGALCLAGKSQSAPRMAAGGQHDDLHPYTAAPSQT